jgi:hypothetical protein
MTLEHVVDVRHARHRPSMNQKGPTLPDPRSARVRGGGREGGHAPLPLVLWARKRDRLGSAALRARGVHEALDRVHHAGCVAGDRCDLPG